MADKTLKSLNFGGADNYFPLPLVTAADNNKILSVVNGEWAAAEAPSGGGGSGQYVWSKQFAGGTATEDTAGGTYELTTTNDTRPSSEIEYSASAPTYNTETKKWEMSGSTVVTLTNADNTVPSFSGNTYVRLTHAPNVWYLATAINVGGSGPYTKSLAYNAKYTADIDNSYVEYVTGETEADYPDGGWIDGAYFKAFTIYPKGAYWKNGTLSTSSTSTKFLSRYDSFCYADGIWVACANKNNTGNELRGLYYSEDGKSWTWISDRNIYTQDFNSVYHANGVWMACSDNEIFKSTDGKTWIKVSSYGGYRFSYYNGLWLCGGYYSTNNGDTWINNTVRYDNSASTGFFTDVAYNNDIFVASDTDRFYYSTDGKNWYRSPSTASDKQLYIYNIHYANGLFVGCSSVNSGGLWYSTDGQYWNKSNISNISIYNASYANGVWMACSYDGLYHSVDGKSWDKLLFNIGFNNIYHSNGIWIALGNGVYYSNDSISWHRSNIINGSFYNVYSANDMFVLSSEYGLFYSDTEEISSYGL